MQNKRLEYLLNLYLVKTISPAEEEELFHLLDSEAYDDDVRAYLKNAWTDLNTGYTVSEQQTQKILSHILGPHRDDVIPIKSHRNRYLWLAASTIGILFTIALVYKLVTPSAQVQPVAKLQPHPAPKNDIQPGKTGAILKLANGNAIMLDSAADGNLTQQGNMLVVKNGGSINYVAGQQGDKTIPEYNTIETPMGRQFQLVLEDGTKVWLNAASSIRFPVFFSNNERRVEITGEAYFEVAKNKSKPFRVTANGALVEVLGTHFNINAYGDEAYLKTTLLEGSVKVSKGKATGTLHPGEQSQISASGEMRIEKNADVEEAVAWKNGRMMFNNADLAAIMRQVKKWYDVEIVYSGTIPKRYFTADLSRNTNLSELLKVLELSKIHFRVEDKKLIVMP